MSGRSLGRVNDLMPGRTVLICPRCGCRSLGRLRYIPAYVCRGGCDALFFITGPRRPKWSGFLRSALNRGAGAVLSEEQLRSATANILREAR